jgi:hypothetical protein
MCRARNERKAGDSRGVDASQGAAIIEHLDFYSHEEGRPELTKKRCIDTVQQPVVEKRDSP